MCHDVFLAADCDLPLIPATDPPILSVEDPADAKAVVAQRFPAAARCIRRLGSSTGCSCGFISQEDGGSRACLQRLLLGLPRGSRLWLYSCWYGDWAEPVSEQVDLTITDVVQPEAFAERRLIILHRAEAM
jgi:hypothetical protein